MTTYSLRNEILKYQGASAFGIQCICDKITLMNTSLCNSTKWQVIELRSAIIPVTWDSRTSMMSVFELLATLQNEYDILRKLQQENSFLESGGRELPELQKNTKQDNREWPPVLREEHIQFLVNYIDSNATSTVDLAHDELCKAFSGLKISVNAVHKDMRTKCNLYLKRTEILCEKRVSDTTIRKRKLYVEKCKENNVDCQKNCVFIHEAGFNLYIMRNPAWIPKKPTYQG
ncbi:hypothetical protein G6F29_006620 [Rhizopus arrhizus]|uniref:Uncharacterized protein n=1 Tax=Rhizopus oryzae TaxID=64495 RepID=A0A9P6X0R3_RHIOR|nr:hypothetical protein G6F29_006620 [Rhizopus arrhizus]KAG0985899.1 hypothetical protein G6F28_010382 [Rhizopus arrhizus]KAG1010206.1 hypothetical protein G6F27_004869 [Rhizopus arrhizus]KAG1040901.1 hypothetical protein G6F25_004396 [Rhizopus arrhizus]KAG1063224.1 hypothetical protein G6F41_010957 [Rhizopus arrhizus]